MTVLLPSLAALVAILILPGWSFYFDVIPKVVLLLAGASAALILWRPAFPSKWFAIFIGVQAAAILIATVFSTHRGLSMLGSTWRRDGAIAEIAVLILALCAAAIRIPLRIPILAGLLVALYGILQYFGIDPWIPAAGYHFGEGTFTIVRPPATLGHAAYFATYLLFVVFGGVALAVSEKKKAWKVAAIGTSAIAVFAIVLSGTRAALAGLLVGALFVAVRQRLSWKWLAGGVVILAIVAGFYLSPAGEQLRARAYWSSEDPLGGSRLLLWRDSLRMAAGRWLTGYGPETFAIEFPAHQSVELARAYPDFYHESPHNIFLDALVSDGVLGLLPLLALTALGLFIAKGPIGGAFVAILVSQQFTSFTLPTELYFFLSLAILVAPVPTRAAFALERTPLRWIPAAAFAAFAIYLATGDFFLASARRSLDRGDIASAQRDIDSAREWNVSADIYFSRRFSAVRAWPQAMDAARHALQSADDRQNAWVNLAAFYAAQDDARAVELSLRSSIAAAPNWFKAHWLLAQVLAREGRVPEAESEAQAAVERNGGKTPEVARTLEQIRRR